MVYQDKWAKGKLIEQGQRECAQRYSVVKAFCDRYQRPFTVCDVGANMCYFGIRLTEDFPECMVAAFEFHRFDIRLAHLKSSDSKRVFLINRKLSVKDMWNISQFCHFDLVLALSVIHHMREPFDECLSGLKALGDSLIIEFAWNDSARVRSKKDYRIPEDGIVLGQGVSHLCPNIKRPIILIGNKAYDQQESSGGMATWQTI